MKIKTLILTGILAAAGSSLLTPTANAAAVSYANGDLFIGFRVVTADPENVPTGANSSYLLNIGPAAQFREAAPGSTITLNLNTVASGVALDLNSTFGPEWTTSAQVRWGVFGTTYNQASGGDPAWTLYAGKATVNLASQAPHIRGTANGQGTAAGAIDTMAIAYGGGTYQSTANSNFGVVQNNAQPSTYSSFHSAASFGRFQGAEGNFGAGTAGTRLDLYRMDPSPAGGATGSPGSYLGSFSINDAGTITFTAVPEPSVVALLIVSLGAFFFFVRRRSTSQA